MSPIEILILLLLVAVLLLQIVSFLKNRNGNGAAELTKLQAELQVLLDNPGIDGASNSPLRLRGYVVRIEPQEDKERTAVGIVFTE